MIRKFIEMNIAWTRWVDATLSFPHDPPGLLHVFFSSIKPRSKVADVGGGKKTARVKASQTELVCECYDGYDIDISELRRADFRYDNIFKIDLTAENVLSAKTYDYVICLNTLEHVENVDTAIVNLKKMLSSRGKIYIKVPCRYAIFAQINLLLPNRLKKIILHGIYPKKHGDGFRVFYDKCTPSEMRDVCTRNGLHVFSESRKRFSSYFRFFVPLYLAWKICSVLQILLLEDYCESFEMILGKEPV